MRVFLTALILLVLTSSISAQDQNQSNVSLRIAPHYQYHMLSLQDTIFQLALDDITIETLRFYISNIIFYHQGKAVWAEPSSHHLIDAADTSSFQIKLKSQALTFDEIEFLLGIDSVASTSGAFGGDLDPTNGMYWAWNSGYINFKVEGKSSRCTTRDNGYQFHLGGYAAPFANAQKIRLSVDTTDKLRIAFDLSNFFDQIDLSKEHTIMSPSKKAVAFSKLLSQSFYIDE